ncbi:MAG: hypothetical protein AB7V16_08885 [Vulcanibacillus sp.]
MEIKINTKRIPTSKKLAWGVFLVWAFSVIASYVLSFFDIDTGFILATATTSLGIVLTGFFSKSYLENKEIYGKKQEDNTNSESELGC